MRSNKTLFVNVSWISKYFCVCKHLKAKSVLFRISLQKKKKNCTSFCVCICKSSRILLIFQTSFSTRKYTKEKVLIFVICAKKKVKGIITVPTVSGTETLKSYIRWDRLDQEGWLYVTGINKSASPHWSKTQLLCQTAILNVLGEIGQKIHEFKVTLCNLSLFDVYVQSDY